MSGSRGSEGSWVGGVVGVGDLGRRHVMVPTDVRQINVG